MTVVALYTNFGGMLLHEDRSGVERAYLPDTLGSLIAEIDETGVVTYEANYWPYGEVQSESGSKDSPWGFVGLLGYLKDLVNLIYVRARHYLPNQARWLTVDPLWPDEQSYVFVSCQPLMRIDASGLQGNEGVLPLPRTGSGSGGVRPGTGTGVGIVGICVLLAALNEWDRARRIERVHRLRRECDDLIKDYHKTCGKSYKQWTICNYNMSCPQLKQLWVKYKMCSAKRRLYKIKCLSVDQWDDDHQFPIDMAREYYLHCFGIWKDVCGE